jgi:hypothetical protein
MMYPCRDCDDLVPHYRVRCGFCWDKWRAERKRLKLPIFKIVGGRKRLMD